MLRIKPLLVLCAALLTVTPAASADVNSDMNQFFNKLGFASNTTQPGVWQGQAAGYAYGGSLYARTQVKNIQLISMTLPDINAGCGGIDAYLGSFSFINGDQLQRFVKQIMSNAAGYFFDLALQATVPEIKTAKDFLQKMASDINSMNLSSCQVAQGIVGGLFPQTQVSQQKVCQDIAGESNIFADWAASRQGCTVGGQSSSVRDKASDKDKERVLKNINIIWDSLSKNRMLDGNKELKEFIMTLTGTLIFGEDSEITPLPARTTDRDILRAIMEGGTAKVYHCNDSDKCLKVVADANVTIARDKALKSQITKLLTSIQNKAVSDTPLDDREKGFISSTTVPVFKYLIDPQMLGVSSSVVYQLTDYIGYDIMLQYIQELLQQARAMIATGNYPQTVLDSVLENLNQAQQQIAVFQGQVKVQQDALLVQANVLKADKMDLRESQGWLNRGYEGAAVGAALGAGITGYNSNSAGATLGVGLAAGLVGMAADAMVEDVNYTMITDVQIAERTKATVTTDNVAALRQGTSGAKIQTSTETGNQHKYQTRVVSNANKVNLKFEEAKPVLEDQLAKSIANIL
ncbi:TPA: F-type conjugal transfer protein TraH [Escherichia coli]|nr:F-type conjugal transfer protein TraH [Escherichia coli]HAV9554432.1 F-type conjugal transfer protein TraH [Escherichia coli]HAW5410209.1 F-type conjugal transfer protein TraH [Escherichia coli]HAW6369711.1 F-type conjugal transfer protein TraH [Escherichia coli]